MREFPHSISALIDQRSAVSFGLPGAASSPALKRHNSTFRMAPLKNELQGELDDPAFAGRADFPKCIWRVDVDSRIAEVRTVDDIEELTAKLQALPLGEAELLAHADVGIHRTGSPQLRIRTRRAAELSRQIRRVRRCIEVARDQVGARTAGVEYGAPQTVGTVGQSPQGAVL